MGQSDLILCESEYMDSYLTARIRIFVISAMQRLNLELDVKGLGKARIDVLVLFIDEVLQSCLKWLNEFVRLKEIEGMALSSTDMYKYLAVLLYSHCTGFSMKKVNTQLSADGGWSINRVLINFMHNNILAYSPTGRGFDSSFSWHPQRDQTIHLAELERKSFRMSAKVYLNPNHTFSTLDDDLLGTRAEDNQVKTFSYRKAGREGHSMTAVADAIFRVVLHARLGRRGESKKTSISKLLGELLENRGEICLEGIVSTLDRSFATQDMVISLLESGTSCVSIVKSTSVQGHPFVARSYLTPGRIDDSDEEFGVTNNVSRPILRLDRPAEFVVDDLPTIGLGCVRAVNTYCRGQKMQKVVALAVRNHGNANYGKIVRFLHAVPSPMHESLHHWVTSHHTWDLTEYLYNYKNPNGRITIPTSTEGDDDDATVKQDIKSILTESRDVLTVAQRCADWFTMREFRLTSTAAVEILLKSNVYRMQMRLPPLQPDTASESSNELFERLTKSCFSISRSTDAMTRGTVNQDAVLNVLAQWNCIHSVYRVGMMCQKERPWLASSLDAVAAVDINVCRPNYSPDNEEKDLEIAAVEIKTAVGRDSVARGTAFGNPQLLICEIFIDKFKKHVPKEHAAQIVHYCVALKMNWVLYVCASESQILYTVLTACKSSIISAITEFYDRSVTPVLRWAHEGTARQRPITGNEEVDNIVKARLPFWTLLRNDIKQRGPFIPVRVFKHASQTLYNKTKGGVDGNAQMRAILRCPSDTLKWEQKVVTQVLKSITVNAWVAWRQLQREDMLSTRDSFKSLEHYRNSLNKVESLAYFIFEITPEILAYAESLDKDDDMEEARPAPSRMSKLKKNEITRLISKAKSRKRYRLRFFNSPDGITLRLQMQRHDHHSMSEPKYCALCGNNTKTAFRGHRKRIVCKQCDVHLCIKGRKPFKRSCWDVWHSVKKLKVRRPPGVVVDGDDASDEGDDNKEEQVATNLTNPTETVQNGRSKFKVKEKNKRDVVRFS